MHFMPFPKKVILALALTCAASSLLAEEYPFTEAIANATVLSKGPRPGDRGKLYFNVQGDTSANFASFAVADFTIRTLGKIEVTDIKVRLSQSNSQFSVGGGVEFWLSTDTTSSIEPGSVLAYDFLDTPGGLARQLPQALYLGKGVYTKQENGVPDTFSFTPKAGENEEAFAQLASVAMTGETLRLIVTAKDATTAATWAGEQHLEYSGPELSFTYTAE